MPFNEIIGQATAKEIIAGQLKSGKVPHAYLFLGQEGIGRKMMAFELAKALNCTGKKPDGLFACETCPPCQKIAKNIHPDVQLIDFEWQSRLENKDLDKQKAIKIDTIRALQKEVNLKPIESRWKIFIIDPAEKITLDAANCLLKTLEEPPSWTIIILLAMHKNNLPATIVSRTQIVPFSPLPEKEISGYLTEKLSVPYGEASTLAALSEGSLSAAISLSTGQDAEIKALWGKLRSNELTTVDLLELSRNYSKTAQELISGLLLYAKTDFRASPSRLRPAMESMLNAKKLMETNCNPQMVLDVMLFELASSK